MSVYCGNPLCRNSFRSHCLWALFALLLTSLLHADPHSSAAALVSGDQVSRLQIALSNYQSLADEAAVSGWPVLPENNELSFGARNHLVRTLRQRLRLSGDYVAEMGADPLLFDAGLQTALINFQQRHGLYADAKVAGQTLDMLNLSPQVRIAQLQHALDGWAALESDNDMQEAGPRVWVNIPEAVVSAIANDEIALHMRAVVGHPTRPTPALSSAISKVIVNPSWTVPPGIAATDIVPRQLADPDYLPGSGFRVFSGWQTDSQELNPGEVNWKDLAGSHFPYRLNQEPGPKNSLGRFKFDFPNSHDIYLHDTPVQALLGLSVRSLSAGCVRLEKPVDLAAWLMGESAAVHKRLFTAVDDESYQTRVFALQESVQVDIVYLSAWVSDNGQVNFRRDIYRLAVTESGNQLAAVQ